MVTPYDWQEGIGHRAAYVESRIAAGTPVLAVSLERGLLIFTVRRQARKIYEIYDRLAYAALGQQSDVESMRVAAIDFAHQEGFQRSEQDVTVQRVVMALSQPLKRAFGDFNAAPFVVRSLFCEVGSEPAQDHYYVLDYDGDFSVRQDWAFLSGTEDQAVQIRGGMNALDRKKLTAESAIAALKPIWAKAIDPSGEKSFDQLTENLVLEAGMIERSSDREERFHLLNP